jgi:IS5 family transposase
VCIVQSGLSAAELLARAEAHKLIRKRDATEAAVHDSQKLDDVLDLSNTGKGVWADSAYRSVQIEAGLKEKGLQSRIHRRAARDRPLSERQKSANDALMQTPPRGVRGLGRICTLWRLARGEVLLQSRGEVSLQS